MVNFETTEFCEFLLVTVKHVFLEFYQEVCCSELGFEFPRVEHGGSRGMWVRPPDGGIRDRGVQPREQEVRLLGWRGHGRCRA